MTLVVCPKSRAYLVEFQTTFARQKTESNNAKLFKILSDNFSESDKPYSWKKPLQSLFLVDNYRATIVLWFESNQDKILLKFLVSKFLMCEVKQSNRILASCTADFECLERLDRA